MLKLTEVRRISADPKHPWHIPMASKFVVFLDGARVDECRTASIPDHYVHSFKATMNGKPGKVLSWSDAPLYRHKGAVEIYKED